MRTNRNVIGGALSVGGQQFDRGLGVHSASLVRFNLHGEYQEFTTRCGIDDSAGGLADVTARIIIDGTTKWEKARMRAGQPPQHVRVDLRGAQTLELHVSYGDNGDVQDRFNWADAALIRE